jgi:hypothetical protein
MDITPYVEALRRDLARAAEGAGPDSREAADRMLLALEPALRLTLMELLSETAADITAELPAGVVEVRLRGRDPQIVVEVPATPPPPPAPPAPPAPPEPDADEEEGAVARVTLRIPEGVKARAEEHAAGAGTSLNSWIVQVLRRATARRTVEVDIDLSSIPFPGHGDRRMSGWV